MNSLYIHIPFCRKKCIYCDFCSIIYDHKLAQDYVRTLILQIRKLKSSFDTIYIGGGTPTILENNLLRELLSFLKNYAKSSVEFTIEANPESLTVEKLRLFKKFKVNRLSIGVQSFNDTKLAKLGRLHDAKKAVEAILTSQEFFNNINIDLIFGVWGETLNEWKKELAKATTFKLNHLSCYNLTYEYHTRLYEQIKKRTVIPASDNLCAKMYKFTMDYLPKKGFLHYEVSNFAKSGFECKHNMNYWQNNSYTGLGAGAVSFKNKIREQNVSDVAEYIRRFTQNEPIAIKREKLSKRRSAKETAAIKIRTKEGIGFDWFKQKTGFDLAVLEKESLETLVHRGFLRFKKKSGKNQIVKLTKKGFLFCDSVSVSLV